MTVEDNKALVRRMYEQAINGKDEAALDEIMSADLASGTPFPEGKTGLGGFKQVFDEVAAAFPDYEITIEDQIGEDDKVVTRYTARGTHSGEFMGAAPSGERVELTGIDIDRVADGKIAEHWSEASVAALLVKLGFTPPS